MNHSRSSQVINLGGILFIKNETKVNKVKNISLKDTYSGFSCPRESIPLFDIISGGFHSIIVDFNIRIYSCQGFSCA